MGLSAPLPNSEDLYWPSLELRAHLFAGLGADPRSTRERGSAVKGLALVEMSNGALLSNSLSDHGHPACGIPAMCCSRKPMGFQEQRACPGAVCPCEAPVFHRDSPAKCD